MVADVEEVLRLHAGESAYGPSPAVRRALAAELDRVHRYPDGGCGELVRAIADFHGVDPARVSVGNGLDEVILLLTLALADESRPAVLTAATFASYRESLAAARQPFVTCELDGYRTPVDDLVAGLRRGAALAFVCTPHNPTGGVLDEAHLARLRRAAAEGGGVLVVDEAYAEYAGPNFASALPAAARGRHVCVMRTFSKAYGLAGLRIGYVVGDPDVVARVDRLHAAVPYHVNRFAQRAAVAALEDQDFLRETVGRTVDTRERFRAELRSLGLRCPRSHGNFVLAEVDDGAAVARLAHDRGFRVRDTTDMGLPNHIRISIGTDDQMDAVLALFAGLLDEGRLRERERTLLTTGKEH